MTQKGHRQLSTRYKAQQDSHCWRYYFKKYRCDYTALNRVRIGASTINV